MRLSSKDHPKNIILFVLLILTSSQTDSIVHTRFTQTRTNVFYIVCRCGLGEMGEHVSQWSHVCYCSRLLQEWQIDRERESVGRTPWIRPQEPEAGRRDNTIWWGRGNNSCIMYSTWNYSRETPADSGCKVRPNLHRYRCPYPPPIWCECKWHIHTSSPPVGSVETSWTRDPPECVRALWRLLWCLHPRSTLRSIHLCHNKGTDQASSHYHQLAARAKCTKFLGECQGSARPRWPASLLVLHW